MHTDDDLSCDVYNRQIKTTLRRITTGNAQLFSSGKEFQQKRSLNILKQAQCLF